MPAKTILKGFYSEKNIVKIYPWQLLRSESLWKYLKFTNYWLKVDRWSACVKKKELNVLATEVLDKMIFETKIDFIHSRGPIFYCDQPKGMSDDAYG